MSETTPYVEDGYWQPVYGAGDNGTPVFTPLDTVAIQYRGSPTLMQLIANFWQYVDPSISFQQFYDRVWNIDTASGFGLDILGRIVNVSRNIDVPAIYPATVAPGIRSLNDTQYRALIKAKALTNISGTSASEINAVMRTIFFGRGNAFVADTGGMSIQYRCLFALQPFEFAIMAKSEIVPKPAAVQPSLFNVQPYFGFSEAESWSTFGENVFAAY